MIRAVLLVLSMVLLLPFGALRQAAAPPGPVVAQCAAERCEVPARVVAERHCRGPAILGASCSAAVLPVALAVRHPAATPPGSPRPAAARWPEGRAVAIPSPPPRLS